MTTPPPNSEPLRDKGQMSTAENSVSESVIKDTNRPYQFSDSDITLISSDDLHFKIHSYHLMAASAVFRDMIALGKNSEASAEVRLTDSEIETSTVVVLFLDICYGTPLPHYKDKQATYIKLVKFLDKYDCRSARITLKHSLHTLLDLSEPNSQRCPQTCFVVACVMDDIDLAKAALRKADTWRFFKYSSTEPSNHTEAERFRAYRPLPERSSLDLVAFRFDEFKQIPDDIKFALLRAIHQGSTSFDYQTANWSKIADSFEIILNTIREKTV
ncbi:hypothetical protein IAT40_002961 [Kwoniella sp. CBS 6097]